MQAEQIGQRRHFQQNNDWQQSQQLAKTKFWMRSGEQVSKKQPVKDSLHMQLCDQFQSEDQYIIRTIIESNRKNNLLIFSMLVLITLGLLLFSNYDNNLQLEIIRNSKIITSYKLSSEGNASETKYKNCPSRLDTFHVYLNETDHNLQYLPQHLATQSKLCNLSILGYAHLNKLVANWNQKFTENIIILQDFKTIKQKERILILLKLYFQSGTYTDISIPYSKIAQRCWKYVINGYDALFINFTEKNQKDIYVPDPTKFTRVRFPFSPQIVNMINQLIRKQDYLDECRQRQCLIVKCID